MLYPREELTEAAGYPVLVRFEPVRAGGAHHHHAVCDSCGTVTPFEDPKLEADLHRIGDRLGHTIDEHDVVIHGTCGRCEAA